MSWYEEILSCETWLILTGGLDQKGEPKASEMAIYLVLLETLGVAETAWRKMDQKQSPISHSLDRISSDVLIPTNT